MCLLLIIFFAHMSIICIWDHNLQTGTAILTCCQLNISFTKNFFVFIFLGHQICLPKCVPIHLVDVDHNGGLTDSQTDQPTNQPTNTAIKESKFNYIIIHFTLKYIFLRYTFQFTIYTIMPRCYLIPAFLFKCVTTTLKPLHCSERKKENSEQFQAVTKPT